MDAAGTVRSHDWAYLTDLAHNGYYGCIFNCCPIDSLFFLPELNSTPGAVSQKVYNFLVQITWLYAEGSKNCTMVLSLDLVNTTLESSHL